MYYEVWGYVSSKQELDGGAFSRHFYNADDLLIWLSTETMEKGNAVVIDNIVPLGTKKV